MATNYSQHRARLKGSSPLLHAFGFSVAGTLTLRALSRARAIGALTAITRPLAHRALARSTTHVALHSLFSHDAMYSTVVELRVVCRQVRASLTWAARTTSRTVKSKRVALGEPKEVLRPWSPRGVQTDEMHPGGVHRRPKRPQLSPLFFVEMSVSD